MTDEQHFDRVRNSLITGQLSDLAFGALLPPLIRAKSSYCWTPLAVARRAALRFAEQGTRRVLDVGCGPGKFCLTAALACPEIDFCGVDLSVTLARTAKELATGLRLSNVEFKAGDALDAPWHDFDGFYFFNPFGGTLLTPLMDDCALPGGDELLRVAELLDAARKGVTVITYHGLGGPIPSSYTLRSEEPIGSGCLRVWQKTRSRAQGFYYLDHSREVSQVSREYLLRKPARRKPRVDAASE